MNLRNRTISSKKSHGGSPGSITKRRLTSVLTKSKNLITKFFGVCKRTAFSVQDAKKDTEEASTTPLGKFGKLPPELLNAFFDSAPLLQGARVTLLSSRLAAAGVSYLLSPDARRRFAAKTCAVDVAPGLDRFSQWGVFVKAATAVVPFEKRIQIILDFFAKNRRGDDENDWGRFFGTVSRNWAYAKCASLICGILEMDDRALPNAIATVISKAPGDSPLLEMEVRRKLGGYFLFRTFERQIDESFWLSAVLLLSVRLSDRRFRSVRRISSASHGSQSRYARLISILYAPTTYDQDLNQVIDWHELTNGNMDFASRSIARPFADALARLLDTRLLPNCAKFYKWSELEVFGISEEVTTSPEPWTIESFAALFVHQPGLISPLLTIRLSIGVADDTGDLLNTAKTLVHRWWGTSVSSPWFNLALGRFAGALLAAERDRLFGLMFRAHYSVLRDLFTANQFNPHQMHEEECSWIMLEPMLRGWLELPRM